MDGRVTDQPLIAALGEHARPLLKEIGYAPNE